jgi:hypothetical protein
MRTAIWLAVGVAIAATANAGFKLRQPGLAVPISRFCGLRSVGASRILVPYGGGFCRQSPDPL